MLMTNRARHMVMLCVEPVEWPTLWDSTDDELGIDLLVEEVYMGLSPINCDALGIDLTELNANLSALKSAVNNLALGLANNQQGECSMCNNCCNCGNNNTPPIFNPSQYPNNPPLPSDQVSTVTDIDCLFANFMADRCLHFFDVLSNSLVYVGWLAALTALATALLGQVYITATLISAMSALILSGYANAAGIASVYAFFLENKADYICYVSTHSSGSATSFKQASLAFIHGLGDDNDARITFLLIFFGMAAPYNKMYDSDWQADYVGATCCGDTPPVTPPAAGIYELRPVTDILATFTAGASFSTVTTETNKIHLVSSLGTFQPFICALEASWTHDAAVIVVGYAVMCEQIIKTTNSNPTYTFFRDLPSTTVPYGVIYQNNGFAGIIDTETGADIEDFKTYLASLGYAVFVSDDQKFYDMRTDDLYEANLYDKEGTGGNTSATADLKHEMFFIVRIL